jgi:hypothetical protein
MKKITKLLYIIIMALFGFCISFQSRAQNGNSEYNDITFQQFYDDLTPYGQWVDYSNYGYVWVPDEVGFRPYYSNGRWVYTDYGWTWASNYDWGWAPFHYGRWLYDQAYGWMWVPGYDWAPAWVSWRSGGDYYGWAPLGPEINVGDNFGSNIPYGYWSFVPRRYINEPRINNYYINRQQNVTIINNTIIVNNTRENNSRKVYIAGPSADDVEKDTHEKINTAKIIQKNRPGTDEVTSGSVVLYKPTVKNTAQQNQSLRPSKIGNLNDIKARHMRDAAGKNNDSPADNSDHQLNPTDRIQPSMNADKNNTAPQVNQQKKTELQQKANNQKDQPADSGNIKQHNPTMPANEKLNSLKVNQRDTVRINNASVEKPQSNQQNLDKKNQQSDTRHLQNQNNNQVPPLKNNLSQKEKVPVTNPSNDAPVNKPVLKSQPNNDKTKNNNVPPVQKNIPRDQPPVNNQSPKVNKDETQKIKPDTTRK